jgi:hypothetical protein
MTVQRFAANIAGSIVSIVSAILIEIRLPATDPASGEYLNDRYPGGWNCTDLSTGEDVTMSLIVPASGYARFAIISCGIFPALALVAHYGGLERLEQLNMCLSATGIAVSGFFCIWMIIQTFGDSGEACEAAGGDAGAFHDIVEVVSILQLVLMGVVCFLICCLPVALVAVVGAAAAAEP